MNTFASPTDAPRGLRSRGLWAALTLALLLLPGLAQGKPPAAPAEPELVPVEPPPPPAAEPVLAPTVKVGNEVIPHEIFGIFVMPEEQRAIEPVFERPGTRYSVAISGGTLTEDTVLVGDEEGTRWVWTAPAEPGVYPITLTRLDDGAEVLLNAFVMTPSDEILDGRLKGFRIGSYPAKPLRGRSIYLPPRGFIEVTAENRNTQIAPHFRVGEFVAKQAGGYPKFVVLRERLILKLEMIIDKLQEAGYHANSLHIMSGYRTPFYNRAIGNVQYSRHVWGGAADVFVDERPKNGVMDDLNGDGRVTRADAAAIYQLIDQLADEPWYKPFIGGLGLYGPKPGVRGPFIHVDVRGYRARWGH